MTETQGCKYWHPYTCVRAERCPQPCRRKEALDEYRGPDQTDPDYVAVVKTQEHAQ